MSEAPEIISCERCGYTQNRSEVCPPDAPFLGEWQWDMEHESMFVIHLNGRPVAIRVDTSFDSEARDAIHEWLAAALDLPRL